MYVGFTDMYSMWGIIRTYYNKAKSDIWGILKRKEIEKNFDNRIEFNNLKILLEMYIYYFKVWNLEEKIERWKNWDVD